MPEDNKSDVKVVITDKLALKIGETFDCFEELRTRLNELSNKLYVYYWLRDSRTVEGAYMKTSRPIAKRLKYYSLKYACIFGGQKFQTRSQGRRNTPSMRNNCPAFAMLRASKCGDKLEVISVCNVHNHELSEELLVPPRHKLTPEIREEILQLLLLKIERDIIIEYIQLKYKKSFTRKDLMNLSTTIKGFKNLKLPVNEKLSNEVNRKIEIYINEMRNATENENKSNDQIEINYPIDLNITKVKNERNLSIDDIIEYVSDNEEISEEGSNIVKYSNYTENIEQNNQIESEMEDDQIFFVVNENTTTSPQYYIAQEIDFNTNIITEDKIENYTIDPDLVEIVETKDDDLNLIKPKSETEIEIKMEIPSSSNLETKIVKNIDRKLKRKSIRRRLIDSRKRIFDCTKCGTHPRLLSKQIAVLKSVKRKLDQETKILALKKLKLQLEIKNLINLGNV